MQTVGFYSTSSSQHCWILTSYLLAFRCSSSYKEATFVSCCFTCCSSLLSCLIRSFAFLHSWLSASSFIQVSCSCLLRVWQRRPFKLNLTFLRHHNHPLFFPTSTPSCEEFGGVFCCDSLLDNSRFSFFILSMSWSRFCNFSSSAESLSFSFSLLRRSACEKKKKRVWYHTFVHLFWKKLQVRICCYRERLNQVV